MHVPIYEREQNRGNILRSIITAEQVKALRVDRYILMRGCGKVAVGAFQTTSQRISKIHKHVIVSTGTHDCVASHVRMPTLLCLLCEYSESSQPTVC